MKPLLYIVLAALVGCSAPPQTVRTDATLTVPLGEPRIDTLHLGRVAEGQVYEARVILRNDAAQPAVILEAELSCDCVSIDYPRQPIAPGAEAPVAVRLHTGGLHGGQMKPFALRTSVGPGRYRVVVAAEVE